MDDRTATTVDARRQAMVNEQLLTRDITDERVLSAMTEVPRHLFVPDEMAGMAYMDGPLPIGCDQTISQPYIVALMIQEMAAAPGSRVLEIGTGSGYAAAVLSRVAGEVFSVERLQALAERAVRTLKRLHYSNVTVLTGDGSMGWQAHAPYDAILVSAGAPVVPAALIDQLRPGGRLIIPVGGQLQQRLVRIEKDMNGELIHQYVAAVRFVPLIGEEGWSLQ